jgi:hypothetical protein
MGCSEVNLARLLFPVVILVVVAEAAETKNVDEISRVQV